MNKEPESNGYGDGSGYGSGDGSDGWGEASRLGRCRAELRMGEEQHDVADDGDDGHAGAAQAGDFIGVAVDGQIRLAMAFQHRRHQSPDPAIADDDGSARHDRLGMGFGSLIVLKQCFKPLPGQPEQWRNGQ